MSAIDLLNCPFCGGEAKTHGPYGWSRLWCISHNCTAFYNSASEAFKDFPSEAVAITAWNRRTDLSQASVAAALEAAVGLMDARLENPSTEDEWCRGWVAAIKGARTALRALITDRDRDALAAHVAAEVAKARAEDAAMTAELVAAAADVNVGATEFNKAWRDLHGEDVLGGARWDRLSAALAQIGAKP